MTDSFVLGGERQSCPFRNRQSIQVRPQSHAVCRVGRPDVRDQTAADKGSDAYARRTETGSDRGRGSDLFAGQLGVRVEVTAEGDELVPECSHRLVQPRQIDCGRWRLVLRVHER
jgi:hypothetical protein